MNCAFYVMATGYDIDIAPSVIVLFLFVSVVLLTNCIKKPRNLKPASMDCNVKTCIHGASCCITKKLNELTFHKFKTESPPPVTNVSSALFTPNDHTLKRSSLPVVHLQFTSKTITKFYNSTKKRQHYFDILKKLFSSDTHQSIKRRIVTERLTEI